MGSTNRVSQACNPCRSKKRRCDGTRPVCGLCSRLNTECEYKVFDKRQKTSQGHDGPAASPTQHDDGHGTFARSVSGPNNVQSPNNNPRRLSALRANSGALSADLVRQNLGSTQTRNTHTSPWNLGIRMENQSCDARPIHDIISLSEYDRLVAVYFEKIHILQGTFSEALFNRKKRARWNRTLNDESDHLQCFDLLFAIVGCIAALFSGGSSHEAPLAECATLHLHQHLLQDGLTTYDVDGLILRTLYLRLTTGPRASWLSSCLTMSALQDSLIRSHAGPHATGMRGAVYELDQRDVDEVPSNILHEKRYRLAKNMNDWMSNESGRPKAFSGTFPWRNMPMSPGLSVGPAGEALTLAEISTRLDPDDYEMDDQELGKFMDEILAFTPTHDFVRVSQVMVGNMAFRRMRSLGAKLSPDQASGFVAMCCLGLDATCRLAADRQPWHHCANVPFQVLCTFLLLDTRESLSKVAQALATIRGVYDYFPTPTMQNTLRTATHLVDLARQRKEQDSADLSTATSGVVRRNASHGHCSSTHVPNSAPQNGAAAGMQTNMDRVDVPPGLLEADFSSWDNIDWDQVLQSNAILGSF